MAQDDPRRRMSTDQKRGLVILALIGLLIAVVVIGVFWLAASIGAPWWLALILSLAVAAGVALFMLANLS